MYANAQQAPAALAALLLAVAPWSAQAASFELPYGGGITGTLNTSLTLGGQWRMQSRSPNLVGKLNNSPNLCPVAPNGAGTSCQGHLDEPTNPALNSFVGEGAGSDITFVNARGQASSNNDDGDLNYNRGNLTQAVAKVSMDLSAKWNIVDFFMRGYYFYNTQYDNPFTIYNPDIQTVHTTSPTGTDGLRRGPGEPARYAIISPNPGEGAREMGTSFRLLDMNLATSFDLLGQKVSVKAGRQPINWGESTLLIVNSLNTFNPPNQNALYRPAFLQLEEVLTPVGAVVLSSSIVQNVSADFFWQYDWEPAEIPPPGSFLSTVDVGTHNERNYLFLGFDKGAEDPNCLGLPDQLMLSAVSDTCSRFTLRPQKEASSSGQFGLKVQYFADWLNNGTTLAFYAAQYNSRLPFVSFYEGQYGCLNGPTAPAPTGVAATDTANVLNACPGADGSLVAEAALGAPNRDQNIGPDGNAFVANTIAAQLEYPEHIQLYGMSFNTTAGDFSIQGEVAYRPNSPLQIDNTDLAFAALQNTFPKGCAGSNASASCVPGSAADKYDVGIPLVGTVAQLPGQRYAIPDYVSAYRGIDPSTYKPGQYIQGYERFKTAEYDLGATYVMGASDQPFKADQILLLGELGATEVFGMPGLDTLQIAGPGTFTHHSAGADGTGASQAGAAGSTCPQTSNSQVCGPSGIRFNPTQQNDGFATPFSWGYRLITIARYEGVLPGVNLENTLVWAHDVGGTAPGPGENFVEGRKSIIENMEWRLPRFAEGLSVATSYVWFFGGGVYNLLSDRDFAQCGVRYRF